MKERELVIGEVGNYFRKFDTIDFVSNQSLLDFDLIFLDINYISHCIAYESGNGDPYSIEEVWVHENKRKILVKRMEEIKEYVKEGRILVIFLPKPQVYNFLDGSYAKGNPFVNTIFSPIYLLIDSIEGTKIDIVPNTRFAKFLKKYEPILSYNSCFNKSACIGTPIGKIKGTDKVIASFKDNVYYLPSFAPLPYGDTTSVDFFGDDLIELLIPPILDYSLPKWVEKYLLPSEIDLLSKRESQIKMLKEIEKEIKETDFKIENLNKIKFLLTGSGDSLEEAVTDIFKALGFAILDVDKKRDDLIVKYKETIAVVEIKGVNKSATEEHAMQLEKWISEYSLDKKVTPKGILIVNAFREMELSARTSNAFPNQMRKFSEKRDHCLMTTMQLLGLYYDCIKYPEEKDKIINQLLETIGEFTEYKDWSKFINI